MKAATYILKDTCFLFVPPSHDSQDAELHYHRAKVHDVDVHDYRTRASRSRSCEGLHSVSHSSANGNIHVQFEDWQVFTRCHGFDAKPLLGFREPIVCVRRLNYVRVNNEKCLEEHAPDSKDHGGPM